MVPRTLIQFIFSLACPLLLSAQDHSYSRYDVKDGLSGSTVYSIVQDKDGFMWFATETGLSRFDGTHFKNFTTSDGLPDNEIINLKVDSKGRVWIMPFKNSIAYYWKGRIYNQQNDSMLHDLKITAEIRSILEDKEGNILICEPNAMHIIDPTGHIDDVTQMDGKPFGYTCSGLDKAGRFLVVVASIRGLNFYFVGFEKHTLKKFKLLVPGEENFYLYYVSETIEVRYTNGIFHFFNPADSTEFRIPVPNGFINLSILSDSTMCLNTYNGVFLLNTRQKKITDSFLTGKIVNAVTNDSEGNLWFSTMGNGVYRLASTGFINYTFTDRNNTLPVFCINRFDSLLYLGADRFTVWTIGPGDRRIRKRVFRKGRTRGRIVTMVGTSRGIILGTDNGLSRLQNRALNSNFMELPIKSIFQENDSVLLVCSGQSACRFRLKDLTIIDSILPFRSTCGYKKDGLYYIGTLNGLLIVDEQKHVVFAGDRYKVLKSRITDIKESADGTIWIATNGEGLIGYKNEKVIANIRDSDGLTSNICRNIFISGDEIWVGTDKGLNKMTLGPGGEPHIISFTSLDGLNSDIINTVYVEGTRVFAGTAAGMTAFDEKLISRRSICNLQITGITVGNQDWAFDTTGFVVHHRDNDIQFDFVGISYKSAGNITYKYRLNGLDDKWKTTARTSLSYLSLPSGTYRLDIQATNKFGVLSGMARVDFTIDKLLWERTWFRISVLLFLAGGVWLAFTTRVRMIKKKEEEKSNTITRMAELEQMALRSQMNPHFIFNCLNSIQQYVIDKDVRGVNEFITNFSRLIRQTLEFSIRPRITLEEEIRYISTYLELEKRRFEDKFDYEIVVGESIHTSDYHIPPMILQPYIENAIRHGIGLRKDKKGRILIRMVLGPEHLVCTVEDNGVGRKVAAQFKGKTPIEYQSQGMKLTEKRIGMFNQTNRSPVLITIEDLEDQQHTSFGTRITLFFPLESIKANA